MASVVAPPQVSVVIPAYNSEAFITAAIDSVLAQTFADYELIVIDDGSSDHTAEVVRGFGERVRYERQRNQGAAAARNTGIRLARGELVCLLDADDLWAPEKLTQQVALANTRPSLGLLFADAEEWEGITVQKRSILETMKFGPAALRHMPLPDAFAKLLLENFIPTSTVMMRRACFATAGLFDETLPNAEDRDMWLRFAAHFEIGCVPQVLATKRSHGANISSRTQLALQSRIKVWTNSQQRFPSLVPAAVYSRLLADTYQQLGYILLTKGDRGRARTCAIASLTCALRYVAAARRWRFDYHWSLAIALVPLSLIPWPVVRSLWQVRNALVGGPKRTAAATSSSMLGEGSLRGD